ncbi:MAG: capsule assembly Wzi family protein [Ignavibacteriaceae bacterium]|nr:capsule assembly Wzi family protein [Ignavibacteriaceae bacterium]
MKKIIISLLIIISIVSLYAQNSIEPEGKTVYNFLERMSLKRIITSDEFLKPLLRKDIGKYLNTISINASALSKVEKEELAWYLSEYTAEVFNKSNIQPELNNSLFTNSNNRFRVFYYSDTLFNVSFAPVIKAEYKSFSGNSYLKKGWGFNLHGSIGENFGFRLDFSDNSADKNESYINNFSAKQGEVYRYNKSGTVDFSNTNGSMVYSNNWLTIGALKENYQLGSGERSQLILSSKAPSFASFFMKIKPADWLSIYSMHGWLLSNVVDSALSYATNFNNRIRQVEREKYVALHAVQIKPFSNLSFSLGESIVYSDKNIYWGYFIPFLFYRSVDHMFTFGKGDSGNNGSLFFDMSHYPIKNLKYYFTLYIDELSLTNLLKGETDRNQLGFTGGISIYEPMIENLKINVEYTRILPWVYSNWIPAQTYTNAGYLMGHYIGQNADQIFVQADYLLMRGLEFKLWSEYIRKGGTSDISNQYTPPGENFLYGSRRNELNIGLGASYEIIHDAFVKAEWQYSNITDEDKTRTPEWMLGSKHSFSFGVYYGM